MVDKILYITYHNTLKFQLLVPGISLGMRPANERRRYNVSVQVDF